jgi:hypothetical protein
VIRLRSGPCSLWFYVRGSTDNICFVCPIADKLKVIGRVGVPREPGEPVVDVDSVVFSSHAIVKLRSTSCNFGQGPRKVFFLMNRWMMV